MQERPKSPHGKESTTTRGSQDSRKSSAEGTLQSSQDALYILERLQTMPWCRMDCSFKGTTFPYFAHNLIQVTREWLNWEGEAVVHKLAEHFTSLEKLLEEQHKDRGQPSV